MMMVMMIDGSNGNDDNDALYTRLYKLIQKDNSNTLYFYDHSLSLLSTSLLSISTIHVS